MCCEPDPQIYRSVGVALRQAKIRKIKERTARQELAQRPPSGARNMAFCKKTRCCSAHLFVRGEGATPKATLLCATPNGCRQIAWLRVTVLLVVFPSR